MSKIYDKLMAAGKQLEAEKFKEYISLKKEITELRREIRDLYKMEVHSKGRTLLISMLNSMLPSLETEASWAAAEWVRFCEERNAHRAVTRRIVARRAVRHAGSELDALRIQAGELGYIVAEGLVPNVTDKIVRIMRALYATLKKDPKDAGFLLAAGILNDLSAYRWENSEETLGTRVKELSRTIAHLNDVLEDEHMWKDVDHCALIARRSKYGVLPRFDVMIAGRIMRPVLPKYYDDAVDPTDKRLVIDTDTELLSIRHRVLRKDGEQFAVSCIIGKTYDGFSTYIPLAMACPVGAETPYLEPVIGPQYVRFDPVSYDTVERFTYAYLKLKVDAPEALYPLVYNQTIYRLVERNTEGRAVREDFFCLQLEPENDEDGHVIEANGKPVEKLYAVNLLDGSVHDPYLFLGRGRHDAELKALGLQCIKYTPLGGTSTNGEEKNGEFTFSAQNLPGFYPWRHVNRMTQGAYRLLRKEYGKGENLGDKKMAQLATRMAQFKAPMATMIPLHGICIFSGKVKDALGNEYEDGFLRIAAEYCAEAFSDDDYRVTPRAVEGNTAQSRPLFMCKGNGLIMPRYHLIAWLKDRHVKVDFIFQDEIGYSAGRDRGAAQAAFDDMILRGCGKYAELSDEEKAQGYKAKAVAIIPSRMNQNGPKTGVEMTHEELLACIDVLVDLNVMKTVVDLRYPMTGLNVLDLSHGKHSIEDEANTSNQLLQSAMVQDPISTSAFIQKRARETFRKIIEEHLTKPGRAPHAGEIQDGSLQQVIPMTFAEFSRKVWAPVFQDTLNKRLEGWSNRLAKMATSTDGIYVKIIPDMGHAFTKDGVVLADLLGVDPKTGEVEIFSPMMEKEGLRTAVGVKYPKMGFQEFGKFKAVYSEELVGRARKLLHRGVITKEQYFRLVHLIRSFKTGSVMVPAIEELKDMLAGMDFDGDALILYTDKELVDIIWKLHPVSVHIEKDNDAFKFSKEDEEAYQYFINMEEGKETEEIKKGIVQG